MEAQKSCVFLASEHSGFPANHLSIMGLYMLSRLQLKIAKGATICYSMPEVLPMVKGSLTSENVARRGYFFYKMLPDKTRQELREDSNA